MASETSCASPGVELVHEGHCAVLQCRGYGLVCRREDDGTFVVLMQSVEHPDAPLREAPFYNWRAPIRAQVRTTFTGRCLLCSPAGALHSTVNRTGACTYVLCSNKPVG